MGRESRHLWVGNVPDNASETDIVGYFTPFGEVDKIEVLTTKDSPSGVSAVVSFLSLQIAAKIHKMTHKMSNNALSTRYHDFSAANSAAAAADAKSDIKEKRPSRNEEFHRKRSPSPSHGRDIKRKIEVEPAVHHRETTAPAFEYRKRVIIAHNLPGNHSVQALTTGLYHEFKQLGKIKQLWMNVERGVKTAVIMFHDSQVAHMAFEELNRKILFGKTLDLELVKDKDAYTIYPDTADSARRDDTEDRREPAPRFQQREIATPAVPAASVRRQNDEPVTDEGASSTLFVGNLSGNVRYKDLMNLFKRYGDIECIDIKESDKGYPYAFIRYYHLKSASAAKKYLNEEILHERCMKIGYGKGCQTNTVMAMEIDRSCPESKVEAEFGKFGELVRMTYNQTLGSALCTYGDTESAQQAIENMRGRCLGRTGRVKVDFANHEECQEFYKNYEQCKASQQLMRYHMDILSQAQASDREPAPRKKYDDFKVRDRRDSYPVSPERRVETQYSKRYERVERTTSRNIRDITPSPPRSRVERSPVPRTRTRSFDADWKGKGKALPVHKHPDDNKLDRGAAPSRSRDTEKVPRVVASRYNSEERELARHIRDSRNGSRERDGGSERVDFNHSNMKRVAKKPAARRSSSRESPVNEKYSSSYKDNDRAKDSSYSKARARDTGSMMDNDWNTKKYSKESGDKTSRKSRSRGGSPDEKSPRDTSPRDKSPRDTSPRDKSPRDTSPRDRSPHDSRRDSGERREKRKKERRSTLSEQEEEILNSLIQMRREEKSKQKKNLRKDREDRREREAKRERDERRARDERRDDRREDRRDERRDENRSERRDSEDDRRDSRRENSGDDRRDRSKRERSDRDKRKRKRKHSKDSTDASSDNSSSSSSESSEREIDVGNHDQKQQEKRSVSPAPPDSALDRIAKIISDSTNGQVQLNAGSAPASNERYSPDHHSQTEAAAALVPAVQTMIPIPAAAVQPFLPPPPMQLTQSKELLGLLRKYPIMWNGSIALKNDTANVQLHFLSGSAGIAEGAINALPNLGPGPMRIAQRMRLEPNQIEGVQKRMQHEGQWCMMLALPHGTDPLSVSNQTTTLQHGFITYLESKQAAGIINLPVTDQPSPYVLHIFPPCDFTRTHMKTFCPELIDGAGDCGYLLIVIATV